MLESGSLERRDIDPGHKQEDSWEPRAMNKIELADGPKGTRPRRALGKFTHVDADQMAQLGRRSRVPATTLEGRGEEGRCQGQGASGEAAGGAGRRRSYRRGCQCRRGAAG